MQSNINETRRIGFWHSANLRNGIHQNGRRCRTVFRIGFWMNYICWSYDVKLLLSAVKQHCLVHFQSCLLDLCLMFQDFFSHKIVRHINLRALSDRSLCLCYDTGSIPDCISSRYSSVLVSSVCYKEVPSAFISFTCALTTLSVVQSVWPRTISQVGKRLCPDLK